MTYRISVFGSAKPKPESEPYQSALYLGRLLGRAKYTVLTGGYSGTMEATSRGTAEAGGHVIGVTCDEVERWRPLPANQWVQEKIQCATLQERVNILISECDAAIALPGGIGTLAEIAMMWNSMQIRIQPVRPIILVGKEWQATFTQFLEITGDYVTPFDRDIPRFAPNIETAFQLLQQSLKD